MSANYYNTTHSSGSELAKYEALATAKQEQVALWWSEHPKLELTREEFCNRLGILTQSACAILRNLVKAGVLEKTARQKIGRHGRPCYHWRLARRETQLTLL